MEKLYGAFRMDKLPALDSLVVDQESTWLNMIEFCPYGDRLSLTELTSAMNYYEVFLPNKPIFRALSLLHHVVGKTDVKGFDSVRVHYAGNSLIFNGVRLKAEYRAMGKNPSMQNRFGKGVVQPDKLEKQRKEDQGADTAPSKKRKREDESDTAGAFTDEVAQCIAVYQGACRGAELAIQSARGLMMREAVV